MATPAPSLTPSTSTSPRDRWTGLWVVLAVAFFRQIASALFVLFHGMVRSPQSTASIGVAAQICDSLIALTVLLYVLRLQKRPLAEIGFAPRLSDLPISLALAAAHWAVFAIARTIWAEVSRSLGHNPAPPLATNPAVLMGFSLLPVVLMLVNPWFEELIVRGYFMTEVSQLTGRMWLAVLASVLLQGSYHLYQGWHYAVPITIGFLVYAGYFAAQRRIVPIVLAHTYMDLLALAFNGTRH